MCYLKHLCYYFKHQVMTDWADQHSTYMAGFGLKQGQDAASPVGQDWPCPIFDAQLLLQDWSWVELGMGTQGQIFTIFTE